MIWKLIARDYHCAPYKITPGARGWSVWIEGEKRIGMGIEMLTDAKKLAEKHSKEVA